MCLFMRKTWLSTDPDRCRRRKKRVSRVRDMRKQSASYRNVVGIAGVYVGRVSWALFAALARRRARALMECTCSLFSPISAVLRASHGCVSYCRGGGGGGGDGGDDSIGAVSPPVSCRHRNSRAFFRRSVGRRWMPQLSGGAPRAAFQLRSGCMLLAGRRPILCTMA